MGRRRSSKYDIYGYLIIIVVVAIVCVLRFFFSIICGLIVGVENLFSFCKERLINLWEEPDTRKKLIIISALIILFIILLIVLLIKHHKKIKKEKEEFYKKLEAEDRIRQEAIRQEEQRIAYQKILEKQRRKEEAEAREADRLRREYLCGYREDMTGYEYEKYCADLFKYFSWDAKTTKKSGDFGADVIATKDGIKIVAQCKKWKGSVGFDAVKEVFTAKTINKADYALVITNSHFSDAARKGANDTGVILIRHADLENCLKKLLEYEKK